MNQLTQIETDIYKPFFDENTDLSILKLDIEIKIINLLYNFLK